VKSEKDLGQNVNQLPLKMAKILAIDCIDLGISSNCRQGAPSEHQRQETIEIANWPHPIKLRFSSLERRSAILNSFLGMLAMIAIALLAALVVSKLQSKFLARAIDEFFGKLQRDEVDSKVPISRLSSSESAFGQATGYIDPKASSTLRQGEILLGALVSKDISQRLQEVSVKLSDDVCVDVNQAEVNRSISYLVEVLASSNTRRSFNLSINQGRSKPGQYSFIVSSESSQIPERIVNFLKNGNSEDTYTLEAGIIRARNVFRSHNGNLGIYQDYDGNSRGFEFTLPSRLVAVQSGMA
jgi:hypothetical protein